MNNMQVLHIAGYKFIQLLNLESLRAFFLERCEILKLKGTILLSKEGININLTGTEENIKSFKMALAETEYFFDMSFRESHSTGQPYKRLKIKLKKEIITLKQADVAPLNVRAPSLTPEELKQWLDEARDFVLLDTRNDYEIRFGSFTNALNLKINNFCEFPDAISEVEKGKPIVMFCTGGIRCEKAAIYMLNQGYENVFQLDGGILNYFAKIGGQHYQGDCYVFDERVALDNHLNTTGTVQCVSCQGPVTLAEQKMVTFIPGSSCPHCILRN